MSAISFKAASVATSAGRRLETRTGVRSAVVVDGLLLAFCSVMLALMSVGEGEETIPYHFLFLALTLVYGFRVWPIGATILVALAVTGSTGFIMYGHYRQGAIDSAELAEIPLMPALFLAMVWHARRREAAQRQVERMADQRRASLEREREFFRDASHAIRTPVTIARGHLELLESAISEPEAREDVAIAQRQLSRMSALSNRLLALAQLDSGVELRRRPLDLAEFMGEIGRNWSSSAHRDWTVSCSARSQPAVDVEWLGLAVDALVENAVRFTEPGDEISLMGASTPAGWSISIADSGPGVAQEDLDHIFERFWHRRPLTGDMGSGLGLAMALATARAHGGELTARNQPGGGAVFELLLPG